MLKERPEEVDRMDIFDMIEDILKYLEEEEEEEYDTTQEFIGFKHLFQGIVIRDWKGTDLRCRKYRKLNKILVKHCVMFYKKCWDDRNELYHDIDRQRNRICKWYEKIKEHVRENEPVEVKTFAQRTSRNINENNVQEMRQWIYNVKEISKKVKSLPQGDIRRFLV